MKKKEILRFDTEGNLLAEFDSIKSASQKLNIDKNSLSHACRGKRNTVNKSIWMYKASFSLDELNKRISIFNNDIKRRKQHCKEIKRTASNFMYSTEDVVNTKRGRIKILKQLKHRGEKYYEYNCLECGNEQKIPESYLVKGGTCSVCSNHKVKIGINDMWTTNQEMARQLANPKDGYKYTDCSGFRVDWKCIKCSNIIKNKKISDIKNGRVACNICSDGISYPNKLLLQMFIQLEIEFEREISFDWCTFEFNGNERKGIYDFGFKINAKNYIVEADGGFHKKANTKSKMSLEDIKFIDNEKDRLAFENGYHMIRIDCCPEEFEIIKNNILQSELHKIFCLDKINWETCNQNALKSIMIESCELYNTGLDLFEISDIVKVHSKTVRDYLKRGAISGLCDYDSKNNNFLKAGYLKKSSQVRCKNNGYEFDSLKKAAEWAGLSRGSTHGIAMCCRGEQKTSGVLDDGTLLMWEYVK